jgi:hypothetical protein
VAPVPAILPVLIIKKMATQTIIAIDCRTHDRSSRHRPSAIGRQERPLPSAIKRVITITNIQKESSNIHPSSLLCFCVTALQQGRFASRRYLLAESFIRLLRIREQRERP